MEARVRPVREPMKSEQTNSWRRRDATISAPARTKRGASRTSGVVAPDARAIRLSRLFFHWKTI